jgi:hypothetical protein
MRKAGSFDVFSLTPTGHTTLLVGAAAPENGKYG